MQLGQNLFKIELVVIILVPDLLDVHRWRDNACTCGELRLIGEHLEQVLWQQAFGKMVEDLVVEAETHDLAEHGGTCGILLQNLSGISNVMGSASIPLLPIKKSTLKACLS